MDMTGLGSRRMVRVAVSNHVLVQMMKTGWAVKHITCIEGVPPGAMFVGSFIDDRSLTSYLVFQHESFAEVQLGEEIPYLHAVYQTSDCQRATESEMEECFKSASEESDAGGRPASQQGS